jgi:hypothetical protein
MERRTKVELFEQIRKEYEFGEGPVLGIARKLGVHRRTDFRDDFRYHLLDRSENGTGGGATSFHARIPVSSKSGMVMGAIDNSTS